MTKHPRHPRVSPTAKQAANPRHHLTHGTHGTPRVGAHDARTVSVCACVSRVCVFVPWVTWVKCYQRLTALLAWVYAVGAVGKQNSSWETGLKVLVACEYSGAVRDAFIRNGHEAMSCDLLPTDVPGPHYQGDVRDVLDYPWDLMVAHPPCTDLSVSGARHFSAKRADGRQQASASFFLMLARAGIERIAIENPVCVMSSLWRRPDQVVHPWQYGHGETKATCLWLKNLPPLTPTNIVEGREARVHLMPPGPNRWKERSRTYSGIAEAMATQWGTLA